MNWNECFSTKRLSSKMKPSNNGERTPFEIDQDRIIFCSAFRRMQDKTQVIPLPDSDFVHTRLTHSIEAANVGRGIGKLVGREMLARYAKVFSKANIGIEDFGMVVSSACLAHDIGNPPFGHSGEDAIRNHFLNGDGKKFKRDLNVEQWNDLIKFEGNARGFKILTNGETSHVNGMKLTCTTLAAFSKYPRPSHRSFEVGERSSQKKHGYNYGERGLFQKVAEETHMEKLATGCWARHPLAFLVEAADDICYSIIDFEDGARLGWIPIKDAHSLLMDLRDTALFDEENYNLISNPKEKTSYLRANVIGRLVRMAAEVFVEHETDIRAGHYDKSLVDSLSLQALKEIKKLSYQNVYKAKPVINIEAAGFSVLSKLLEVFIDSVNEVHDAGAKQKKTLFHSQKIIQMLPVEFINAEGQSHKELYRRIECICDYVAGMTDSYALSTYRKIMGIEIK